MTETEIDTFLVDLVAEAKAHRAVNHRYLRGLASGSLPNTRWALADFARQYFGYSVHFPRYLATVIGRLERPEHRRALLENMVEESGSYQEEELIALEAVGVDRAWITGVAHPVLFQRFRTAMDVVGDEESIEVVCWREMFLDVLSSGSPAEAVGALGIGTEGIVSTMYLSFVTALGRLPDLSPRDTVFFPLHTAVDDHHQDTLLEIARHYATNETGRCDLAKGMRKALALRSSFWDWMHDRATSGYVHVLAVGA